MVRELPVSPEASMSMQTWTVTNITVNLKTYYSNKRKSVIGYMRPSCILQYSSQNLNAHSNSNSR